MQATNVLKRNNHLKNDNYEETNDHYPMPARCGSGNGRCTKTQVLQSEIDTEKSGEEEESARGHTEYLLLS
jgi:hypothetical protein